MSAEPLTRLDRGTLIIVGGNRSVRVSEALARAFEPGDSLAVVESTGDILHIPAKEQAQASAAVAKAHHAFQKMGSVTAEQISAFYEGFARRIEDDAIWQQIQHINDEDVAAARQRGRSTTRLEAGPKLRASVIAGLRGWSSARSQRGRVLERIEHEGWHVELVGAELGVVGFIFEGRPNVVADATGVLRGGNTVVFRIGRDALGTAREMLKRALTPALIEAGLPEHAVSLVDSQTHAAGWALFSDTRLSLAVARGSGPAVETLGGLAKQSGIAASLHGTGGAWICVGQSAEEGTVEQVVFDSLDRKVCNTLNTCCITSHDAERHVPAFLRGLTRAAERRGCPFKLHVTESAAPFVPEALFSTRVKIQRAEGAVEETQAEPIASDQLGREWEWEGSPEVTLTVVDDTSHAVDLFNAQSPQFVASLLSQVPDEHEQFYQGINAPFVGDAFTRWVDGQFALRRPELGLSNWAGGRLFGRGGILSGDSVYTVRTRARRTTP